MWSAAAPLLLALVVSACATLPSIRLSRELPLSGTTDTVEFEGPSGPVPAGPARDASLAMAASNPASVLDAYLGMSARLIGEPLIIGNRVDLLVDGPATYAAMFRALSEASRTIDIQSYIFDEVDHDGVRLSGLLVERFQAGVMVRVLVDGVGSMGSGKTLGLLESQGIPTCIFNPVTPSLFRPARLNHRDHRKVVVVDGDDAFAGGVNFSRVYRRGSTFPSGASGEVIEDGWRDTHVRIRGPGGRRLAELFADSWAKQKCGDQDKPGSGSTARAVVPKQGETVIQVIPSSPDSERNLTYLSVLGAVAFARQSIAVTMAYFVPDEQLEDALIAAALRGVDVRLILPAFSDFSGVFHAGRSHYTRLLRGNVRIYEQQNALLHAKTVVIDKIWSTVGSTNWDWRSFVHNDEISIVVIDEGFARRMQQLFEKDLENASEVSLEEWLERPWTNRLLERFWVAFERLL
jgi:cardiolipin synthase